MLGSVGVFEALASCRVKALAVTTATIDEPCVVVVGGGKDDPCTASVSRSSGAFRFLSIGLGNCATVVVVVVMVVVTKELFRCGV